MNRNKKIKNNLECSLHSICPDRLRTNEALPNCTHKAQPDRPHCNPGSVDRNATAFADVHPDSPHPARLDRLLPERDDDGEIYNMNPNVSNQIQLTDNTTNDCSPSWSPGSRWIVFNSG